MSIHEQMAALTELMGKPVTIMYQSYGVRQVESGDVKDFGAYLGIQVGSCWTPFIGYGCAVERIAHGGTVVYENTHLPIPYDVRSDDEIDAIKFLSFGDRIASEHRKQRLEAQRKWNETVAASNRSAKKKAPSLIVIGHGLVVPAKRDDWVEFAKNNTQDGYSCAVVEASIAAMRSLASGGSPHEAETACHGYGLSGFQMGCVAKTVAHFHERGEEFRSYWNRQWMGPTQQDNGGVANPAVWTLGGGQ